MSSATKHLNELKRQKIRYCKGKKGAYAAMRSACKKYVAAKVSKAKKGSKTATKEKAMDKAQSIIKGGFKRG